MKARNENLTSIDAIMDAVPHQHDPEMIPSLFCVGIFDD